MLLYTIRRLQHLLPLNSAGLPALSDHLALNTAVSPVTKTNWQLYGGETTMSLFSRMAGMTVHNLVSAATSIALALAVVRSFASTGMAELGNFWADLTCTVLHVCLPICFMTALVFVALGVSQSLQASISATTREGAQQMISIGPVASRRAIKQLGKNRGGFFSANSAYPFENPNAWANLLGIRIWHRVQAASWLLKAFPFLETLHGAVSGLFWRFAKSVMRGCATS